MIFYALLIGPGYGCDYTIGCNRNWKRIEADSLADAKAKAVDRDDLTGRDARVEEIILLEVTGEHSLANEIRDRIADDERRVEEERTKEKRAQLERLKRELGET